MEISCYLNSTANLLPEEDYVIFW